MAINKCVVTLALRLGLESWVGQLPEHLEMLEEDSQDSQDSQRTDRLRITLDSCWGQSCWVVELV